jgi:hypothetical protein
MCIHLTVGWFLSELWSFMCLMDMVHFCVLCIQLVIYYLADFVHIWYNGWVWSEHVHIIPIFTVLLLTVRWIHIGMSYCSFHVDTLKIHHFVCVFLNVQPNHSVLQGSDFWKCGQNKLCMLTFCILLNTCFLEMWLVKEENLLKVQ